MGDREFAGRIVAGLTQPQRDAGLMAMRDQFTIRDIWKALGDAGVEYWSLAGAWGLAWEQRDAGRVHCADARTGKWERSATQQPEKEPTA